MEKNSYEVNLSDIVPIKRIMFCGFSINCPAHIDAYLKTRYGDYMSLPPEDKRHNHPPFYLELC